MKVLISQNEFIITHILYVKCEIAKNQVFRDNNSDPYKIVWTYTVIIQKKREVFHSNTKESCPSSISQNKYKNYNKE